MRSRSGLASALSACAPRMPAAADEASAPGIERSSTTMRPTPRRARRQATAQPITPPPTMTTSACMATDPSTLTFQSVGPRIESMVRFIQAHAKWVVLLAMGIAAVAAAVATRLELRTSFAELLPSRDPGVVQLHRMEERFGGFEAMVVAIQS